MRNTLAGELRQIDQKIMVEVEERDDWNLG